MSRDDGHPASSPPEYIITTPSEADTEEERSLLEFEGSKESAEAVGSYSQTEAHQTVVSQVSGSKTSKFSSRTVAMTNSSVVSTQQQQQQLMTESHYSSQKSSMISSSTRSQSLQSNTVASEHTLASSLSATGSAGVNGSGSGTLSTSQLAQQVKAQSSTSIVTNEQRSSYMQKTSSTSSSSSKTKFQSFLQHPDAAGNHPSSSSSGGFLTAHQKHVRQFVRSTSAHSEATASASLSSAGSMRPDKCVRSASTQIEEPRDIAAAEGLPPMAPSKLGLHHSSSILISKSAEAIEMKTSSGIRTQLTLSGGLLAPPNRKITILSPMSHAPPGLHDMLKRAGRSPLSPRISFPGTEADLFG